MCTMAAPGKTLWSQLEDERNIKQVRLATSRMQLRTLAGDLFWVNKADQIEVVKLKIDEGMYV